MSSDNFVVVVVINLHVVFLFLLDRRVIFCAMGLHHLRRRLDGMNMVLHHDLEAICRHLLTVDSNLLSCQLNMVLVTV